MPVSVDMNGQPVVTRRRGSRRCAFAAALLLCSLFAVLLALAFGAGSVAAKPLHESEATLTPAPGTGSVAGQAWVDADGDGVLDKGEAPLAGMIVVAQNSDTGATSSAMSGADGWYQILGLAPGIYQVTATPPTSHALTTAVLPPVGVGSANVLTLNFGARIPPTPTPTATRLPILDIDNAEQLTCGGVYSGSTATGQNNVATYSCRPWWDESGKEKVYRLELDASQPVTVTLLNASADLDLFLLRYAFPDSCRAAGDNYLSYSAEAGPYFLSVDGYRGATGDYTFRVDCPADTQATPTPTFTPSATPTNTPTRTPAPTFTPSPAPPMRRTYLPMIVHPSAAPTPPPVTFVLQQDLNGYTGATDTTLNSWEPTNPHGSDKLLRLFHARDTQITSQMEPALRFDLSLLPTNARVEKALLRLYAPAPPLYDIRAQVVGLLKLWSEEAATWQIASPDQPWTKPGAAAIGSDRTEWASASQRIVEGARWYEFDVTDLVQSWSASSGSNYGMMLMALAGDSNANVEARFVSREGDQDFRPQLVVSCTLAPAVASQTEDGQ